MYLHAHNLRLLSTPHGGRLAAGRPEHPFLLSPCGLLPQGDLYFRIRNRRDGLMALVCVLDGEKENTQTYISGCKSGCLFCKLLIFSVYCGERGIRTPGTVIPYVSLANWWFKPLTHLSGLLVLSGCKYKPKKRLSKGWRRRKCRRPSVAFGRGHSGRPVKTTEKSGECLCKVGRQRGEP